MVTQRSALPSWFSLLSVPCLEGPHLPLCSCWAFALVLSLAVYCILLSVAELPHTALLSQRLVVARIKVPAFTHLSSPGVGAEEWDIEGAQPHPETVYCHQPRV